MIATLSLDMIVTIAGILVTAAVAILNALKKEKYARTVRALWEALSVAAKASQGSGDFAPADLDPDGQLSAGATDLVALREFVHTVISARQAGLSPEEQKAFKAAGNGDWNAVWREILKPKAAAR